MPLKQHDAEDADQKACAPKLRKDAVLNVLFLGAPTRTVHIDTGLPFSVGDDFHNGGFTCAAIFVLKNNGPLLG